MIQSAIGPIALRAPTEIEAIRFEDRHRASRRKAADGESVEGALYDNGLEEVLACVTSHKAAELHPADDGLLSDSPGVYERLCDEFRRLGGGALALCDSADAITEDIRLSYGRKALGFEYGGIKIVVRKLSWAEFQAFIVEREDGKYLGDPGKVRQTLHADSHRGSRGAMGQVPVSGNDRRCQTV